MKIQLYCACFIISALISISCVDNRRGGNGENPSSYDSLVATGNKALKKENIFEAIKEYKDAVVIDSNRVEAYYGLGVAQAFLCNQKKLKCKEALINLKWVDDRKPGFEKIDYNLGILYYNLGEYTESVKHYKAALEKEPNDNDVLYNISLAYLELRDTLSACNYIQKGPLEEEDFQNLQMSVCKELDQGN